MSVRAKYEDVIFKYSNKNHVLCIPSDDYDGLVKELFNDGITHELIIGDLFTYPGTKTTIKRNENTL